MVTSVCATVFAVSALGVAAPDAVAVEAGESAHETTLQVEAVSADFSVLDDILDILEEILGDGEPEGDPNPDGWVAL